MAQTVTPVREMTLLPADSPQVPAPGQIEYLPNPTGFAAVIERLATNPAIAVETIERLIALQERTEANRARAEFFAAFAEMQKEIPTNIEQRGHSNYGNYALNHDIQTALRPVLQRHGFALSFRMEFPEKAIKVIGVLAHKGGHVEMTEFLTPPDTSGSKNAIQALASAQSYAQRYLTRALLNITSTDDVDDDGRATSQKTEEPDGFADWFTDLELVAENGLKALESAWAKSKKEYKEYAAKHYRAQWEKTKAKAAKAVAS